METWIWRLKEEHAVWDKTATTSMMKAENKMFPERGEEKSCGS